MSVEAVTLNETIKSIKYEGGEYTPPPRSAPPIKKIDSGGNHKEVIQIESNVAKGKEHSTNTNIKAPEKLMDISSIKENIEENYEKIKERIQSLENTELKFERDKETKRDIIKILDKKTKKVIRQIPPKEFYKFIVELYKQNKKNTEKMEKKEGSRAQIYEKKSELDIKGLILNRNI